jgi:integrase
MRYMISRLTDSFGSETELNSITANTVSSFVKRRAASAAPTTIALELRTLRRILDVAVGSGMLKRNPAKNVAAPRQAGAQPHPLTRAELQKVHAACPNWLRPIVEFSLATGRTQSDVIRVRHGDLKKVDGKTYLAISKGRSRRLLPLNCMALRAVESVRKGRPKLNDLVFQGEAISVINISQAFRRASRAAGVNVSFKDLKDTAAVWMLEKPGVGLETLAAFLGRKSLQRLEKYSASAKATLSEAVSAIDWTPTKSNTL